MRGWTCRRRPPVLRGDDGWLFYADDGALEDFTNDSPLTPPAIAAWRETVIARPAVVSRARGLAYVFTVTPDKHVVYSEKFPDTIRQLQSTSRTDQVLNAVADTGVVLSTCAPRSRMRGPASGCIR